MLVLAIFGGVTIMGLVAFFLWQLALGLFTER